MRTEHRTYKQSYCIYPSFVFVLFLICIVVVETKSHHQWRLLCIYRHGGLHSSHSVYTDCHSVCCGCSITNSGLGTIDSIGDSTQRREIL